MRIFLLTILLLANAWFLHAQDFTNKGNDFWVGYGNHVRMFRIINASNPAEQMQLYITSDVSTPGKVDIPGIGFSMPFTVTANQITTIDIPRSAGLFDEGLTNLGIHVTAAKPVVVYSFIYVGSVSGATLCLPTTTLGKEYYSLNFTQVSNESDSYSYFFAIATDTGTTTIQVTPSQNTKGGLVAGTTYTYTLNQGQVYQFLSPLDLTGSRIQSVSSATGTCKKIAVFSGSGKISIGCGNTAGTSDNLYQQMYPTSTWGKNYITVPSINKVDTKAQTNFYRIFRPDPAANVTLNGVPLTGFVNNQYFEFSNAQTNYIHSDKPILVAQYFTSGGCSNNKGNGDPEMIFLNPTEQTIASVTLNSMQPASGTNINEHYINAVVPNSPSAINSFKIDGAPISNFASVPQNNSYAYVQVPVAKGTHTITCDSGFNAIAYGFGSAESYGYSAGTNLKDLYQFITIDNKYAIVNFPAGCRNSPLKFAMTFPYQPLKIQWMFNGLLADTTITAPVYDSTWVVNDKTLYRYSLNKYFTVQSIGTYPIKVVATSPGVDGCGGEQEINYDLQIFERPSADFSFTNNGCVTDPVLFKNTADGGGRAIIKYLWDFGDGKTADSSNPSHTYTSGGNFSVKYAAITDIGCLSDTITKTVSLFPPPTASFALQGAACVTRSVTLADNSTATGGSTIVKWYWNFGDNSAMVTKSDNSPVQHVYAATGLYKATLQVELASGCKSLVDTVVIKVSDIPYVNFSMPSICLNDPVAQFYDSSSIADNSQALFTYLWDFGNSTTDNKKDGQGHFTAVGVYNVKLTVTSKDGCVKDSTQKFTVNGAVPQAVFSVNGNTASLCSNKLVVITDASTIDYGKIVRTEIYWDYAGNPLTKTVDSLPSKGKLYTHQYPAFSSTATKSYQVRYVVYSGYSCISQSTITITLQAVPQLQFAALAPVCEEVAPFQITSAKDISVLAATGIYSGKGITADGMFTPSIAGAGTDSIKYVVTAANGCTADTTGAIIVYPTPVISAGPDKFLLEGSYITLEGQSSGTNPGYLWSPPDFIDNIHIARPRVTAATHDMLYTLQVTSADGCKATDDVKVTLLKDIKVPNAFSPNGDGINDTWVILYLDSYPDCTVDVYNRYGQPVFHSTGYNRPWDGRVNGQALPIGTYYWIINPKSGRGPVNGSVTIIR
ncbi:MAG: PKD domain-containing protein [Chitinophagaceae bacterium]